MFKTIEEIAEICHEANRAYCYYTLDDSSQVPWANAPDWQKESAIAGVKGIFDDTIKAPGDSHASWLQHKNETGWVYGEVKNEELKQHPCIVPFDLLPLNQQFKDILFFAIAKLAKDIQDA